MGVKKMLPVRTRHIKTDLQSEINNFVKWGITRKTALRCCLTKCSGSAALRKAAVFTSPWKCLSLCLHILYPSWSGGLVRSISKFRRETHILFPKGMQHTFYRFADNSRLHENKLQFSRDCLQHMMMQTHYCLYSAFRKYSDALIFFMFVMFQHYPKIVSIDFFCKFI